VLNFLAGCRSAGITAFVLLLLIREHGLMMPETAAVLLIGNVFSLIGYRLIGQLANRFHPPTILSFIYLGVSITFLGFSYINSKLAMTLLLFLDSILLGASVVTDSYLKGVSRAKDTVGDIASGYTFFHLGKTIFPLVGGMLWSHFNQQATFLLLSILAVLAVWVSTKLNDPHLTGEGRLVQQVVANQMR
jgi:predicted MFS family arabinose efflux permease